ncbi:hypothetical protein [Bauldia litoralis]|uniref:hypothetical protein n=1 Tax=Bauldia litoralis TaxID=665467 RepID=UPI003264DACA
MVETAWTPGPWEYIASTEHHGPYVSAYGDICDCYTMSNPSDLSVRNGGTSHPILFQGDRADANARLIAAAPDLYEALVMVRDADEDCRKDGFQTIPPIARAKIDRAIAKAETGQ